MNETESHTTGEVAAQATQNPYLLPVAIVVAGVCVAAAIIFNSGQGAVTGGPTPGGGLIQAEVLPVTEDDHLYGSMDADVFLVEYSDYRCGFCGVFHETILEVLEKYEGRVAWVYRHTPYQPGGMEAAVASECIAKLVGDDAFWEYTNQALQNTSELNTAWHKEMAAELGADPEAFATCLDSDEFDERIALHTQNSQDLGGRGTPFSVILTREGNYLTLPGALPIDSVMLQMERAFKTLEG